MLDARDTIILCRMKSGMTLEEVARRSGVNHTTVHNWEVGKADPTFFKMQCVLGAMGFGLKLYKLEESDEID